MATGYCVYEKKREREVRNPKHVWLKNGLPAVRGTCARCGKVMVVTVPVSTLPHWKAVAKAIKEWDHVSDLTATYID